MYHFNLDSSLILKIASKDFFLKSNCANCQLCLPVIFPLPYLGGFLNWVEVLVLTQILSQGGGNAIEQGGSFFFMWTCFCVELTLTFYITDLVSGFALAATICVKPTLVVILFVKNALQHSNLHPVMAYNKIIFFLCELRKKDLHCSTLHVLTNFTKAGAMKIAHTHESASYEGTKMITVSKCRKTKCRM